VGGVPELVKRVPVGEFLDHGLNREDSDITRRDFAAYLKAIEGHARRIVHPGDTIDLPGLSTIVLTADGEHIADLPGIQPVPTRIAPPSPNGIWTKPRIPVRPASWSPSASSSFSISAT